MMLYVYGSEPAAREFSIFSRNAWHMSLEEGARILYGHIEMSSST